MTWRFGGRAWALEVLRRWLPHADPNEMYSAVRLGFVIGCWVSLGIFALVLIQIVSILGASSESNSGSDSGTPQLLQGWEWPEPPADGQAGPLSRGVEACLIDVVRRRGDWAGADRGTPDRPRIGRWEGGDDPALLESIRLLGYAVAPAGDARHVVTELLFATPSEHVRVNCSSTLAILGIAERDDVLPNVVQVIQSWGEHSVTNLLGAMAVLPDRWSPTVEAAMAYADVTWPSDLMQEVLKDLRLVRSMSEETRRRRQAALHRSHATGRLRLSASLTRASEIGSCLDLPDSRR